MLKKINSDNFIGGGAIKVLYPGTGISKADTGIGSIGRIDHANFIGNKTIFMHPHINDEIVSYFRSGKSEHKDSEGFVEYIDQHKLMFMRAGREFYHEEKIFGEEELLEGLQIFIRPGSKDLDPEVLFLDLDFVHSENKWRLLGSPTVETKFQFSSQTWLYDIKLLSGAEAVLPTLIKNGLTVLLYVFNGNITVNKEITLEKRDSLLIKDEEVTIIAKDGEAELVLFITDENAEAFKEGMYSGNKAGKK